ncbi:MAG TPA: HAD family hydrolase [Candidatus Acidoferrales bacterium]|nr:HAD family hydrolase [Candidatus Acidoferrales bacterium]
MIAAFFDIDRTLITADSGVLYAKYLLRRGELRRRDLLAAIYYHLLHRLNLLDVDALFARYTGTIRGRSHAELQDLCADWYAASVRPVVNPHMAAAVAEHRRAGHVVAILSSATNYVGEPLAQDLGIQHLLVNRLLVRDGYLTGEAVQPLCYGAGKVYWAERFAADQHVDLQHSYFYTDSITDLPMLERVGHPCPVNPDRLLRRHARRCGWPVTVGEAS